MMNGPQQPPRPPGMNPQGVQMQFAVEQRGEMMVITFSMGVTLYQQIIPSTAARHLAAKLLETADLMEAKSVMLVDAKGRPSV